MTENMKLYIETDESSQNVVNVSTIQQGATYLEVVLEDSNLALDKLFGYSLSTVNGIYHMSFDQEKYDRIKHEKEKAESIKEAEAMLEEKSTQAVLASVSDKDAYVMRYLYPEWEVGSDYIKNDRLMYKDKFYKVLQNVTEAQAEHTPDKATSLYVEISDPTEEWPEFKQPTGAHDAYHKGDKVTFKGKHYISKIDANTYSPDAYSQGWELVE